MTIVFAFDPVPELEDRVGFMSCTPEVAARLVDAHRVETMDARRATDGLRYVAGSAAWSAARDALRAARTPRPRVRKG